uniref:Uncharacterized protein n=1 Tax=Anguilla anguilla TaxID=7936 RepID=A0A0E9UPH0_ANGAN
MKPIKDSAES